MTGQNTKNEHEGHFYKGLFFGLLIGVGMIWFLNSEGGKDIVRRARNKIDEALTFEPGIEDYDEDMEDDARADNGSKTTSKTPKRFFQKKTK
ncbi:MAG: hypothetical protein WD187_04210 [Candidatus Woykebacteria bacterium]